jgi:hypothetical protein
VQALAYYERAAKEAEQQGKQVRAARAWHTAAVAAFRTGHVQKAIQAASRFRPHTPHSQDTCSRTQ